MRFILKMLRDNNTLILQAIDQVLSKTRTAKKEAIKRMEDGHQSFERNAADTWRAHVDQVSPERPVLTNGVRDVKNSDLSTAANIVDAAISESLRVEKQMRAKYRARNVHAAHITSSQRDADWASAIDNHEPDPQLRRRDEEAEGAADIDAAKHIISAAVREGASIRHHLRAEQAKSAAASLAAAPHALLAARAALAEANAIVGGAVSDSTALESAMWRRDRRPPAPPSPAAASGGAFAAADGIVAGALRTHEAVQTAARAEELAKRAREGRARAAILGRAPAPARRSASDSEPNAANRGSGGRTASASGRVEIGRAHV